MLDKRLSKLRFSYLFLAKVLYIKDNLETKINIKMEILQRDEDKQNSSSPTQVTKTIQSLTQEKLKEIKEKNLSLDSFDIYWIVIDRETKKIKKTT